ncbi:conjugal transfer protein [Bacillus phage vB_BhaS-171]|uniref:transcriptional regulator n=1 Tax=Bacillus phage vB_BhaS-171 TaxID=1775140 RepID=UPI000744B5AD|nr:transcriptional regulator [Bacillus phage vB_BhaS-171]ALY08094.1 conjugal transfer protein [Bacillus phage vB_BhaS-171]
MNGKLKQIRLSKNLTQQQLADMVKVEVSYISKIETGKRKPSIALLEQIANALDVPIRDFF